jgi:hypothetical protein
MEGVCGGLVAWMFWWVKRPVDGPASDLCGKPGSPTCTRPEWGNGPS